MKGVLRVQALKGVGELRSMDMLHGTEPVRTRLPDRRSPKITLRWRVAVAFGLGMLIVSSIFSTATWNLATRYMIEQRELSVAQLAEVDLRLVEQAQSADSSNLPKLLTGLAGEPYSTIMLGRPGDWIISGRAVDPAVLPAELLQPAELGGGGRQRIVAEGIPVMAFALPMSDGRIYVELFPLVEFDRTSRFLSTVLVAGTVVSVLLGVAVGWWAGWRALRPLIELAGAAGRVAGGDLRARLPEQTDPELRTLAATFNATADALERRVLRDARFASDVSHELRSPLTTMANATELLQRRRDELPATARQAVDLLATDVDRFQRMVIDLLEISRADQDADNRSLEAIDLAELVRNVVTAFGVCPALDLPSPPPFVLADRRRLDRAVANLIDNAEHHGGGITRIGLRRSDGLVRIEVDDAGRGVPEEMRERIFERFTRGGAPSDGRGTGLGLALVAQHVHRHGGAVWVEESPLGGARFVVELPELWRDPG
jgi:signal transduction histidine kinase